MNKERLTAFTDAILAIIMTILVLELEKPEAATLEALWALRWSFLAYAVSFFWLGAMWVNLHSQWQQVSKIDNKVVWWSIIMLFFSSFFPYVTSFVSSHFMSRMAQGFYWVVVILVSLSNMALGKVLGDANRDDAEFYASVHATFKPMWIDMAVKTLALILAMAFYPPIVMFGVILAGFIPSIAFRKAHGATKKNK